MRLPREEREQADGSPGAEAVASGVTVELREVHKQYRLGEARVTALRGVSLQILSRELVAVTGPSGSGKSTLLNLIGALDEPCSGTVFVGGRNVGGLSDDERAELRNKEIGFVFQSFNLVPVLTALENVALPLELQGTTARQACERASGVLEEVGLAEFGAHRPDRLSGGQRQRVAIARALVTQPSLVLADEPTANLDSETARRIVELMRELNQRLQTTFIFSTHDDRLLRHVGRVIALRDGAVVETAGGPQ